MNTIFLYTYFILIVLSLYSYILWYFKRPFYVVLQDYTCVKDLSIIFFFITTPAWIFDYLHDYNTSSRTILGSIIIGIYFLAHIINIGSSLRSKIPDSTGKFTKKTDKKETEDYDDF